MRSRKLSMDSVASSVSFEDHCESSPAKAKVPDEPQHSLPNDVALGPIMSEALAAVSFGAGAHEARFSRLWTQQHCRELTASFTWHAVCEQFQEKDAATADRIFSHVATAYARALRSARTADQKDTLAWYLPEAIAAAAVTALREAYPTLGGERDQARRTFDATLRRTLFDRFVLFSSGFGGVRDVESATTSRHTERASVPESSVNVNESTEAVPNWDLECQRDCFPHHRSLIGISNANGSSEAQAAFRQSLRERAEAERLALQGTLPSLRRPRRDMAACSPLMGRFIELRYIRPNPVGCSLLEHRASVREQQRVVMGTPTLREVRLDSARRMERVTKDFDKCIAGFRHVVAL
eukprot:jgi/Chrpa1/6006/Chrysochromulina_OHIO_Genome00008899-RA